MQLMSWRFKLARWSYDTVIFFTQVHCLAERLRQSVRIHETARERMN